MTRLAQAIAGFIAARSPTVWMVAPSSGTIVPLSADEYERLPLRIANKWFARFSALEAQSLAAAIKSAREARS